MHCHKTKLRWALLGIVLTFAGIMMVSKGMGDYSTLGIVSGIIVSGIGLALILKD